MDKNEMTEVLENPDGKMDTSEVVFLIGAGVSIPVGIPAMQGMYEAFLSKARSENAIRTKRTCDFFTRELGVPEDLEEFLLAANTLADFDSSYSAPFVKKALSRRRDARHVQNYQHRLNSLAQDVVFARKRILDFMSDICFRFDRPKACNIFDNFIDAISKQGYPVYSTNYDFTFEYVATERKIPIEDNFPQSGQRRLWNPDIHFSLGDALTLIKLHGSVTWYADEEGVIEKILSDTTKSTFGKDVNRLVIFPTRFKDIYDQHFFALYCHFLTMLSAARVLFIVGHSLRDEYIKAAIIERYRKGNFQIVIVDPNLPEGLPGELKPVRLGTTSAVTHVPFGFEEFSDELANLILNSSPPDLANECAKIVHQRKSKSNKITIRGNIGSLVPGDLKTFNAIINAYLHPHEKPAYVRVWLSAEYTTPEGKQQSLVGVNFLDDGKAQVGSGLTGMVQENIPIQIKVPNYPEWIEHVSKATLHVALIKDWAKSPSQAKNQAILVSAERELMYTT
jgi:hypothetical protein